MQRDYIYIKNFRIQEMEPFSFFPILTGGSKTAQPLNSSVPFWSEEHHDNWWSFWAMEAGSEKILGFLGLIKTGFEENLNLWWHKNRIFEEK